LQLDEFTHGKSQHRPTLAAGKCNVENETHHFFKETARRNRENSEISLGEVSFFKMLTDFLLHC
jgi:hypothetical protein